MKLILKNNSSDDFTYGDGSVVVPANSTLDVTSLYWFLLYSDNNFIRDVRLNNITVNDGIKDFTVAEAERYLLYLNDTSNYNNRDTDGAPIVRNKAAKKGWSFWAIPIEITTSTLSGNLFVQDSTGTDIPWINCKIYDSDDDEITTAGLAGINLTQCVKTVIDFEPTFDFEIIGGSLRINSNPTQDVRLWIIGAPDIPAIYGGSKEFASGINLKFLSADSPLEIDGRVTKYLQYNPTTHQGKMRVMLKHPPGVQVNMLVTIQLYRA